MLTNIRNYHHQKEMETKEIEHVIKISARSVLEKAFVEQKNDIIHLIEVNFLLVGDHQIQKYNKEYRGLDQPTDVISFPMYDSLEEITDEVKSFSNDMSGLLPLGDIVISLERCLYQAKEYGHSIERELGYLVVHSMLHLLGFHHGSEEEKGIMREKEEEILQLLDLGR